MSIGINLDKVSKSLDSKINLKTKLKSYAIHSKYNIFLHSSSQILDI